MLFSHDKEKLRVNRIGQYGVAENYYGGPSVWAQNWSAEQRARGRRPRWSDFIEAARSTGWPAIQVPGHGGPTPVEWLEYLPLDHGECPGGVYFVEIRDRVKIGVTMSFCERFKLLQSHSPDRLNVLLTIHPAYAQHESALHKAFSRYRLNGEWFELSSPIRQFMAWAKCQMGAVPEPDILKNKATQFMDIVDSANVVHLVTRKSA